MIFALFTTAMILFLYTNCLLHSNSCNSIAIGAVFKILLTVIKVNKIAGHYFFSIFDPCGGKLITKFRNIKLCLDGKCN